MRFPYVSHPADPRLFYIHSPKKFYARLTPLLIETLNAEFLHMKMQSFSLFGEDTYYAMAIADERDDCWRIVRRGDPRSIELIEAFITFELGFLGGKHPRDRKWLGFIESFNEWKGVESQPPPRE